MSKGNLVPPPDDYTPPEDTLLQPPGRPSSSEYAVRRALIRETAKAVNQADVRLGVEPKVELLPAGRKLDVLVALNVMGFKRWYIADFVSDGISAATDTGNGRWFYATEKYVRHTYLPESFVAGYIREATEDDKPFRDTEMLIPHYSTRLVEAWNIGKAIQKRPFSTRHFFNKSLKSQAFVPEQGVYVAWPEALWFLGDKFPQAVCHAALDAVRQAAKESTS